MESWLRRRLTNFSFVARPWGERTLAGFLEFLDGTLFTKADVGHGWDVHHTRARRHRALCHAVPVAPGFLPEGRATRWSRCPECLPRLSHEGPHWRS